MGRSRYKVIDTHPHFMTCTIVNWLTLFSQPELTAIVFGNMWMNRGTGNIPGPGIMQDNQGF